MRRLKFCNPSKLTNGIGGATRLSVSIVIIVIRHHLVSSNVMHKARPFEWRINFHYLNKATTSYSSITKAGHVKKF